MLKGKAKIDFEQWYKQKYFLSVEGNCDSCGCGIGLPFKYDRLPQTMQQGVLLEFFRERGIDVVIGFAYEFTEKPQYFYQISNGVERKSDCKMHPDYSTAFTHAIDKACEIINGKEN